MEQTLCLGKKNLANTNNPCEPALTYLLNTMSNKPGAWRDKQLLKLSYRRIILYVAKHPGISYSSPEKYLFFATLKMNVIAFK